MSKNTRTITRQTKAFPFQLKDFDDAKGIVKGYLSTFDNVDEQGDRVRPGAFKRTLQNKYEYKKSNNKRYLMPLLWQHKEAEPVGGYLEAKEDEIGLFVEIELDLDVQKGREAYSALKKGYVFQQSMGYDTIKSDYVKIDGETVRDLIEVRLWEGSLVTFPANEEAVVTDVKAVSGSHMDRKDKDKKTIAEHYAEETCKDLLKDWADVYLKIITQSVLDALKIGDQIEQDISQALDDWKEVVLSKFLTQAIECDLPGYISDNSDTYTYSSADSTMLYGSGSRYGYMSNEQDREEKAGKPISAANQKIIDDHVKSLRDTTDDATKAVKSMQDHVKALRTAADDLATRMQGAETPYTGNDPGKPDEGQQEGKAANRVIPPDKAHDTQERSSEEDTVNEEDLELALAFVQGIKTA